jgi:lysophospholipase L1-like esterase
MSRLVLVGDSQLTDRSPRDVIKLGPRLRQRGYDVDTRAIGGLNTRRALIAIVELPAADWTVFCFGANDAAPWKRVPESEFGANYEKLVRRARSPGVLVLGPVPVVESDVPGSRTLAEASRYSAIAGDVADRCGATFVRLLDALGPDDLADDGLHLNDDGYDIVERLVVDMIDRRSASSTDGR